MYKLERIERFSGLHYCTFKKASGTFSKYCRDEPDDHITNSESFRFILKFTNNTNDRVNSNLEVAVSLKYLSNWLWTLEMPLINCEINLMLTYSAFVNSTGVATIAIIDTKLCLLLVTLLTQDNAKLLQSQVFK